MISLEYIAGFIDGEGYLGIIKKTTNRCSRGYYYTPVLKIAQVTKNDLVLREIKELMGYGNLHFKKERAKVNSSKATSLEFRGMDRVFQVIEKIFPYLIVKKKQAEVMFKFQKLNSPVNYGSNNAGKIKRDEIDEQRELLYREIRFLNTRGLQETKRTNMAT